MPGPAFENLPARGHLRIWLACATHRAEKLQFLLEHAGKTATDLRPLFGQRSHVHEALTGKRSISASQARKLGQFFRVDPGLFL